MRIVANLILVPWDTSYTIQNQVNVSKYTHGCLRLPRDTMNPQATEPQPNSTHASFRVRLKSTLQGTPHSVSNEGAAAVNIPIHSLDIRKTL